MGDSFTTNTASLSSFVDPYSRQPHVATGVARLKGGFVGQVYVGNEIVWETKHYYATSEDALAKAGKHVHKTYKRMFGGQA